MNATVSVVIPVYNGENHIENMVKMLKEQTFTDFEVIIVNDGSKDNTEEVCKRCIRDDNRFLLFSKENGGVSIARNYGFSKSNGEYITFVDVDDYIYPEYLEKLYKLIKKHDADWAQCSFIKVPRNYNKALYEKNRIALSSDNDNGEIVYSQTDAYVDFGYRRNIVGFPVLKLLKRDIAEKVSFPTDIKYGEDYKYVYNLIGVSKKIVFIDSIEYLYIQQIDSSTHRKMDRTADIKNTWKMLNDIYREMQSVCPEASGGVLEKCYMQAIRDTVRINDKTFLKELYSFIKANGFRVFSDKNNRIFNRLLGLSGAISARLTCKISQLMLARGFYLKRTS